MNGNLSQHIIFAQERQKDLLREAQQDRVRSLLKNELRTKRTAQAAQTTKRTWRRLLAGAAIGSALFLTACQPELAAVTTGHTGAHEHGAMPSAAVVALPEVTIRAHDYSFRI